MQQWLLRRHWWALQGSDRHIREEQRWADKLGWENRHQEPPRRDVVVIQYESKRSDSLGLGLCTTMLCSALLKEPIK